MHCRLHRWLCSRWHLLLHLSLLSRPPLRLLLPTHIVILFTVVLLNHVYVNLAHLLGGAALNNLGGFLDLVKAAASGYGLTDVSVFFANKAGIFRASFLGLGSFLILSDLSPIPRHRMILLRPLCSKTNELLLPALRTLRPSPHLPLPSIVARFLPLRKKHPVLLFGNRGVARVLDAVGGELRKGFQHIICDIVFHGTAAHNVTGIDARNSRFRQIERLCIPLLQILSLNFLVLERKLLLVLN